MTTPNEVYILSRSDQAGTNYRPIEIKLGDQPAIPFARADVQKQGNMLLVNGHPYRWHRSLGMRQGPDGCDDAISAYRLMSGWRVMCEYPTDHGPTMIPAQSITHPVATFDEAEQIARGMVTRYLASLNSPLRVEIVWQHGTEFGEPVAGLDGNNYTRIQAANAMLAGEWLPLDYDNHDEAGDDHTPPAPSSPPSVEQEPTQDQDTTSRASGQAVVMVVHYRGTGKSVIPTGNYDGATAELVAWFDGHDGAPPERNVKLLRDILKQRGYKASYPEWQWLDTGHGPRRRREVYRLNGHSSHEALDLTLFQKFANDNPLPRLPDDERLARFKAKAMAGVAPFEACQDCHLVQDCPHGWGACDRKSQRAKARMTDASRPRSHKNPLYHTWFNA